MSALISVKNLSRHYGDFCAVDDISFELTSGDILGFLGPNGAGKSSTMQMLTGNLAPTFGEIFIDSVDLLEQPKAAKSSLGYLPENPPLYKDMTVEEYLRFCAHLHGIDKPAISSAYDTAVERCSLGDVQKRLIRNLSKGYQQRVGIAQAILHSPPVIILDEPTVGLDPIQILEIRQLIRTLGENHGIILCTHILPEVQAVCNRVQIINHGKLVFSANMGGNMDEFLKQQTSGFDIILSNAISLETLTSHEAFKDIEIIDENHFTATSDLAAEELSRYIVKQGWGLISFTRVQTTLEQIFIDLTLADNNMTDDQLTDNSSTFQTENTNAA